tara:strand:+ start:814 stop:1290 length:477 start_codon:yes stop_codon:yes gene_type:complete
MKNIYFLILILIIVLLFGYVFYKMKEPMDNENENENEDEKISDPKLVSELQEILTKFSSDIYYSINKLISTKTKEGEEAVENELNEIKDKLDAIDNDQELTHEDIDKKVDELLNYIDSEIMKYDATEYERNKDSQQGIGIELADQRDKVVSIYNKYIN